mgnify:FL=1|jgi:hypothetical protein|tara:strand:- start:239 stop:586 length:348 start_codon:yes stop_codon:yes gene_type:complete
MSNDDYWNPEHYYPICLKCKCPISSTRWCSRECWINKTTTYDTPNRKTKPRQTPIISTTDSDWTNMGLIPPKTLQEIKKQYYKLALKYHPDKNNGCSSKFITMSNSYQNLTALCC